MFRPYQPRWKRAAFVMCGALLGLAPLVYAESQRDEKVQTLAPPAKAGKNTRADPEQRKGKFSLVGTQFFLTCILDRPSQVQRFGVRCLSTPHLDAKIADCCLAGDHWKVRVRAWDPQPNEAVATSSGQEGDFSMPARVFTYSTSWDMYAVIECSYQHGTSVFPIEADILVETGGNTCFVQDLGTADQ
jgi:hypothetical protein